MLLRRIFRWMLNLTVLGAVIAALFYLGREHLFQRVNDEIRVRVERLLAEHFHDVSVSVRSARWIEREGILVRDVAFHSDPSGDPLLRIGEVFLATPIEWNELVSRTPEITRLTIRDAQLKATRQADGQWDVGRLWPPPTTERPIPIDIERATIEVVDSARPDNSLLLRNVRVEISPEVLEDGGGEAIVQRVFEGRAAGNLFGELTFRGVQRPGTEQFELQGVISQLDFSRRLFDRLPEPWSGRLQELRGSDLEARIEFQLESAGQPNEPLQYHIEGEVLGGRIADARLPYTLNNVQGRMEWNNRQLRLVNLSAESGATSFNVSCTLEGFEADSPVEVQVAARYLTLDQRVYSALPASLQDSWDSFAPTGVIHADLHAVFDGQSWTPELHVQCLDVSFAYDRFPYRLTHGQGLLHYAGDRLWSDDFRAAANGQPVEMQFDLMRPGPEGTGWLEGRVLGPVPLDERLLAALEDNVQEVVRSFQPNGMVVLRHARFEKRDPHQESPDTRLEIDLHDCAINFVNFPYPIYNVRGKLLLEDGRWTFRDLVGRNDSAYLACQGSWQPAERGGGVLNLQFDCQSVPLDDELRDALHVNAQTLWRKLQPSGTLDKLSIALKFDSAEEQLTLDLRAQKWPVDERSDGRNVTMHPAGFPYRLENVTGSVRFHDGVLKLEQIRASHGATSLSATGQSVMRPDGQWSLTLNNLMVTQLHLDHDLIAALPENLAEGLESLRLTGPLSVSGNMDVFGQAGAEPPIIADWDLIVDVEDGKIGHADSLENIRGSVQLDGRFDGQGFRSRGELDIDSAMYQGVQLTDIRGPVYLEGGQVLFGALASRASGEGIPRQVTAQVFDGTLSLDARLLPHDDGRFYVECRLNGADLARISQELNPRPTNVTGKVFAQLRLSGTSGGVHTWRGDGAIRLRDADVYKLPVMIALLKILTVQPPDSTAFTTSDVDFRIEGDRLYFNPINFDGDAISLRGRGEMSFQRELNVHFYTLVGRDEWRPAMLRPFLRDASRSLLLIQVGGTLDNPTMVRRPFPQIEETLQQIFPEAGGKNTGRKSPADPLMQALDPRRLVPMK